MCEYVDGVAVASTVILLVGACVCYVCSLWSHREDDRALTARTQTQEEEAQPRRASYDGDDEVGDGDEDGQFKAPQKDAPNTAESLASDNIISASGILKEKYGYVFRDDKLVNAESGAGFVFKGQREYEDLGLVLNEYIYELLQREGELEMKMLGTFGNQSRGFYFASKDVGSNPNGMLVLIHGTGVVRAGQWSRRLIINHSLESGSQMPYIQEAKKRNWSVVVMNTNQRDDYYECTNGEGFVQGYDPEDHGVAVWKDIIEGSPAKRIAIVAHSYGGNVTSCLLREMGSRFKEKVAAIALTDSYCHVQPCDQDYFRKVAKNWVTSSLPVGRSVGYGYDCERVSAGTNVHEETSWKSIADVFKFIEQKFQPASSSTEKVFVDFAPLSKNSVEANTASRLTHQKEAPEDGSVPARGEIGAENAVALPIASQSVSGGENTEITAEKQVSGDGAAQTATEELDDRTAGRLQTDTFRRELDSSAPQQHSTCIEEPNSWTNAALQSQDLSGDDVAAGDTVTTVTSHTTETAVKGDNSDPTDLAQHESLDTAAKPSHSGGDSSGETASSSTAGDCGQGCPEKQETGNVIAAPVSNEGKSNGEELFSGNASLGCSESQPDTDQPDPSDQTGSRHFRAIDGVDTETQQQQQQQQLQDTPEKSVREPSSSEAATENCYTDNVTVYKSGESTQDMLNGENTATEENHTTMADNRPVPDVSPPITNCPAENCPQLPNATGHECGGSVESVRSEEGEREAAELFDKEVRQSSAIGDAAPNFVDHNEDTRSSATECDILSQQQSHSHVSEDNLMQPPREGGDADHLETAIPTSSIATSVEPTDSSVRKMDAIEENRDRGSPEDTMEQHGLEPARPEEVPTNQGANSEQVKGQAVTDEAKSMTARENSNEEEKI